MATEAATACFEYRPSLLDPAAASALLQTLLGSVAWRQEWLSLYGRRVPVPRLLSWCGDAGLNYRYSGADHLCTGWRPELRALRQRLAREFGVQSNFVLLNRYRNGDDYMGWHADDERGMSRTVASVSLGAQRRFLLRLPGRTRSERLDLGHGSLLVMDGALRHSLPPTRQAVGERVNLTFRRLRNP